MIIPKIVHTLGSLEVFEKYNTDNDTNLGFYWLDVKAFPKYTMGFGPFMSLYQAVEHYTIALKQQKAAFQPAKLTVVRDNPLPPPALKFLDPTNKPQGRVIQVDFINKRRIS